MSSIIRGGLSYLLSLFKRRCAMFIIGYCRYCTHCIELFKGGRCVLFYSYFSLDIHYGAYDSITVLTATVNG